MTIKNAAASGRTPKAPRHRVVLDCSNSPSMTKQAHRDECDINQIIARFDRTGLITHLKTNPGEYLDVAEVGTYREALHRVRAVEGAFYALSAEDRAKFDNSPARYLDWASQERTEDDEPLAAPPTPDEQPAVTQPASEGQPA